MGKKLATEQGKNLYEYWGSDVTAALQAAVDEHSISFVVNCASQEYFKAVHAKDLSVPTRRLRNSRTSGHLNRNVALLSRFEKLAFCFHEKFVES